MGFEFQFRFCKAGNIQRRPFWLDGSDASEHRLTRIREKPHCLLHRHAPTLINVSQSLFGSRQWHRSLPS
jgi:hypothetical protein